MDSKKTIMAGLVILLVAAIIYYFFFRENPKLPAKIDGVAAGSKERKADAKPSVVYVPTNVSVASNTPKDELGFPVAFLSYAQGVKNLQLELMKFSKTFPIIRNSGGADGMLGNGTTNAIKEFYPSVAQNIENKRVMSRNDYDFVMADLRNSNNNIPVTPSSPNVAGTGTSSNSNFTYGIEYSADDNAYLRSQGLTPSFNGTFNKLWAKAHRNKNNFTYYGPETLFFTKTYDYRTGKAI